MKNETNYPIVLEFYLLATIFIDVYVFLISPIMYKIYAIVMFAVLVNALINSIDNYNLKKYSSIFCILDIVEYASFQIMVSAVLCQNIALFWFSSFVVQFLYIPWNAIYLKTTPVSAYADRKIRQYSVLDAISGLISLSIFILNLVYAINEWFLLSGFLSWLIILSMWAVDNFSIGSKIDLPGSKIMMYDIVQDAWKSVKSISVNSKGIIKEIRFGDLCATPEPRTEFFMLPGLIDSHVHIDQNPYIATSLNEDSLYEIALNNAMEAAESGVTTVCDMGGKQINNYYIINKITKNVSGISRIETSGCFCSKRFGHYMQHEGFVVEDAQSASIFANYLTKLGIRYAKIMLGNYEINETGLDELIITKNTSDSRIKSIIQSYYPNNIESITHDSIFYDCLTKINCLKAYTYQELEDIVSEFKRKDLIIFAHAFEEEDVKDAIRAGIKCIEHTGDYSEELIQSLIDNDVIVTSTFVAAEDGAVLPSSLSAISIGCTKNLIEKWYYDTRKTLPKLYEKGVKIALGTDAGFLGTPFCSLTREIISLVSDLGIPVKKVLKSATITCAEKLALNYSNNKIGELTPKAFADFVLYESNFLNDVNVLLHPSQVWIRGELVYERKYD